MFVSKVRLIIL